MCAGLARYCVHPPAARAESRDIDSLGWTNREFSCLVAILDHKRRGHQGNPAFGIKLSFGVEKPGFKSGPFDYPI